MKILSGPAKIAFGFGLGVAAAEVVKEILPAFHGLGRPLLKATVKSGAILARNGRAKFAEFRETLEDVTAEVNAEMAAAGSEAPPAQTVNSRMKHAAGVM